MEIHLGVTKKSLEKRLTNIGLHRKVADVIAEVLHSKGIDHVFGITGAGNIQIFDALARHGGFKLIFTHHEQAAVMAANAYFRESGKLAAALVTTGGGSTNALTGVVSANMDSVPVLVLAGNEPSRYTTNENNLRIWGIQGFDSVAVMSPVAKIAERLTEPLEIGNRITHAINVCLDGKQGVAWLEIPLDVQSMRVVAQETQIPFNSSKPAPLPGQVESVRNALGQSKKPILWLGYGVKVSQARILAKQLIDLFEVPFLLSWAASDLISNDHPLYVGKAGVYGQRAANLILQSADYVLAIGTRLAIPQIGYSLEEFSPDARIDYVDIDPTEVSKHGQRVTEAIESDAGTFIRELLKAPLSSTSPSRKAWFDHISAVKDRFPLIDAEHADTHGYMNSYRVVDKLQNYFDDDSVIVTDMGTALLSGFYALNLKNEQTLFTSTGLGEMGFGLPAAVGAAFANPEKQVICLNADGGMMMNLQELQTIRHHNLNIKIFIFNNDGYLMIKRSQIALLESRFTGVDSSSGLTCPDFKKIAHAFEMEYQLLSNWQDFEAGLSDFMGAKGPGMCEIMMDPFQAFLPRLMTSSSPAGVLVSPPLEDLAPLIPIEDLEWALQRQPNPRSFELRGLKDL